MPYYDTLEEDVTRAKEILAKGRASDDMRFSQAADVLTKVEGASIGGGTIYGADTYAAYCLLQSFIEAIGAMKLRMDCGLDACPFVPGCVRHLSEGNRELVAKIEEKDQVILNQVRNLGDLRRQLDDKR